MKSGLCRFLVASLLSTFSTAVHADPPTFEWIASGGGPKSDKVRAVTFAPDGSAFLAGETTDAGTFGEVQREGLGESDFFLAKVSPEGTFLWVRSLGGSLIDRGYGVVADAAGNAYVTGHFQSTDAQVDGKPLPNLGDYDIFLAKYSPNGDLLWIRAAGSPGYDHGHAVALCPDGDIVITGAIAGAALFEGNTVNPEAKGRPVYCAKYSPEGELRWVKASSGSFSGSGQGIGVDSEGNLYIGGSGSGTGSFGEVSLSSKTGAGLVLKLDPEGKALRADLVTGTPSASFHEICVDPAGRVWCAGMFKGSVTLGDQVSNTTGAEDNDGMLLHYSKEGILQWGRVLQGTATDYCLGAATDGTGRIFVSGEFTNEATFAKQTLTSEGATDLFVAAFDEIGTMEWHIIGGGPKGDNAYTTAWHPDGRLLIGGSCTAPASFGSIPMASPGGAQAYGALLRLKN